MTNKEYWKDEIVDLLIDDGGLIAVVNGKPALCEVKHCENCDIRSTEDSCYNELLYWLNSEYISEKIQPEVKNCKVDDPILVKYYENTWGENRMIKHDHNKGEFPFEKSELNILSIILSEKENDMKEDFESKDPYKFIQVVELKAKIDGYLWMMQHFNDKELERKEVK